MSFVSGTKCNRNSQIRMCFWNVGGLQSKVNNKMSDPLFTTHIKNYDLVFLAETHLDSDSVVPGLDSLQFYSFCRPKSKHNNRNFGGLGILIRKEIKPYIKIMPSTCCDIQWVKMNKDFFGLSKDLYICVMYFPPCASAYTKRLEYDILDILDKDITKFKDHGDILLCGDLNARTGSQPDAIFEDDKLYLPLGDNYSIDKNITKRMSKDSTVDGRGKQLLDLCIGQQLRILNGRAFGDIFGNFTCYNYHGSSTVDYVIASECLLEKILYFEVSDFLPTLSDTHCKLSWAISANLSSARNQEPYRTHALLPNFKWNEESAEKFMQELLSTDSRSNLSNFNNSCDKFDDLHNNVDHLSDTFTDILLSAAVKSLRRKKKYPKNKPQQKKWFNTNLRHARLNLINYGKVYTKYPNDHTVKNHYYKLYREYTKLRKKTRRTYKQSILTELENLHTDDPKMYWKLVNDLKENNNKVNSSDTIDPASWISHFKNLNEVRDKFHSRLRELDSKLMKLEDFKCFNELDFQITQSEISKVISKLKCNKSPGLDNISNQMIKAGQNILLPSLQKLFNLCLINGHYPKSWASGYITTIHKSGDQTNPNNYRGITVTSAIGKVFNSVLNNRLEQFLTKNNVINECQLGFTKAARTSDHMFILKTILDKYCNSKDGRVYACFVDFHKAFDTVIHTGLKLKLISLGVGNKFYNIIKKMYEVSKSSVRCGDNITDSFPIKLGVKQGDNLSPNLFKIFINDLPDYFNDCNDPIVLNDNPIHCLLYADDLVLLSSSAQGLQSKIDKLHQYCGDWCLSINSSKTKVLVFNKAGRHIKQKFTYSDSLIDCVQSYKYLGIHFTASGSFSFAQNELYKRALKAYYKLSKDFLSFHPNVKIALHLFDHTVLPILLYGSEIWGCFNPFTSKFANKDITLCDIFQNFKCETLHLKVCKQILGVHRKATNFAVLSELGRFPITFNLVKNMLNYWYRLETSNTNKILNHAYLTSKQLYDLKKPSWFGSIQMIIDKVPNIKSLSNKKVKFSTFKTHLLKHLRTTYLTYWHNAHTAN